MKSAFCYLLRLSLVPAVAFMGGAGSPLMASSFDVNPVKISLGAHATSGLLTVRNLKDEPIRFQVSGAAWVQTPEGDVRLEPSKALVFFPTLFTIQPGEQRKIRIGVESGAVAIEKTFRVAVEELPDRARPAQPGNSIAVLTRMSIPVFLEPETVRKASSIAATQLKGSEVSFRLENHGNEHIMAHTIRVVGEDLHGVEVARKELTGWYVLAADSRSYKVTLPAEAAKHITRVRIEAELDDRTSATALVSVN